MEADTDQGKKIVQFVISERGDSWIEDLEVLPGETLRDVINKRGYGNFHYSGVDIDNPNAIKNNMVVRIRLMP